MLSPLLLFPAVEDGEADAPDEEPPLGDAPAPAEFLSYAATMVRSVVTLENTVLSGYHPVKVYPSLVGTAGSTAASPSLTFWTLIAVILFFS